MNYRQLVDEELGQLAGFEKVNRIAELIEEFSRDLPAYLAELRVAAVRSLADQYSLDEIQQHAGISPSRLRKILER